jgi:hypothetical protein
MSHRRRLTRLLPCLAIALFCRWPAVQAQGADNPAAEAQLEQIREAILNAAVERPTQVLSTAWIDQDGRLHETAHFQTDGEVRSVRSVRMPLFDKAKPVAKPVSIKVELLPSAWRQKMKPGAHCGAPARKLRQPLKIFSATATEPANRQSFYTQTLLREAQSRWQEQVQSSTRWWPQPSNADDIRSTSNAYETALTRTGTQTSWAVRLELSTLPVAPSEQQPWHVQLRRQLTGFDASAEQPWLLQLTMTMGTLRQDGSFEALWSQHAPLQLSASDQQASPADWQALLGERLQPIMQGWAQALEKAWACEPIQFQVSGSPASGLLINAGQRSGLAPGDRVLLVAPEYIPQKILENGAMAHLRLAEVVQVGEHQTAIRQLAGPAASMHSRWVALPL